MGEPEDDDAPPPAAANIQANAGQEAAQVDVEPSVEPALDVSEPSLEHSKEWWARLYRLVDWAQRRKHHRSVPRSVRRLLNQGLNVGVRHWDLARMLAEDRTKPYADFVVPVGERVTLPSTSVVEFFTPSFFPQFERAVRRNGWADSKTQTVMGDDVLGFVRRTRHRAVGGGFSRLATLAPRRSRGWPGPDAVRTELPADVASVEVEVVALTPSLTAVVAHVYWTEDAASRLDEVMHEDHLPRFQRRGRTWVPTERLFIALPAVRAERARLHRVARDVLASRLPGVFADEGHGALATFDVLLTERYDPLASNDPAPDERNYLRALGLDVDEHRQYTLPEVENFRLLNYPAEQPLPWEREDQSWVLAARYADVFNDRLQRGNHDKTPHVVGWRVDRDARGLYVRLALFDLLELKTRAMSRERDIAASTYSRFPVTSAKRLRRSMLNSSFDLAHMTDDLIALTKQRWAYEWDVATVVESKGRWERKRDLPDNDQVLQAYAKRQRQAVRALRAADRRSSDILQVTSNLTASIESTRAQRIGVLVAILSLAVALLSLAVASLALDQPAALAFVAGVAKWWSSLTSP